MSRRPLKAFGNAWIRFPFVRGRRVLPSYKNVYKYIIFMGKSLWLFVIFYSYAFIIMVSLFICFIIHMFLVL